MVFMVHSSGSELVPDFMEQKHLKRCRKCNATFKKDVKECKYCGTRQWV